MIYLVARVADFFSYIYIYMHLYSVYDADRVELRWAQSHVGRTMQVPGGGGGGGGFSLLMSIRSAPLGRCEYPRVPKSRHILCPIRTADLLDGRVGRMSST